eukprot:s2512_g11.t1
MQRPARLEDRDVAFVQRLRNLAQEALTWPHLGGRQRLVWAAALELNAELPPWFLERQNIIRRHPGVDLLSLDGRVAIRCCNTSLPHREVKRFLRLARWVYKVQWAFGNVRVQSLHFSPAVALFGGSRLCDLRHLGSCGGFVKVRLQAKLIRPFGDGDCNGDPQLRQCQKDCLVACANGARVIEMACGTGKTRVLITVPLRALLDQFAPDFPGFCKVGTGYNNRIDFEAKGFIAVTDSVHFLKKLKFAAILVDEAHHPLAPGLPKCEDLYLLSATQKKQPDFRYTMGQAIQEGVPCDYDITVPAVSKHHAYVCLADLLLKQVGRFRRVLAYCNSIAEAKRFQMVLGEVGLATWHINSKTPVKKRQAVIEKFAGPLQERVHVLVTVEVLGEGINIPNADTCMFVEPRSSYRSVIQAIGRVLRHHPAKTLAHIVLPAVAVPSSRSDSMPQSGPGKKMRNVEELNAREADSLQIPNPQMHSRTPQESDWELPSWQVEHQQARRPHTSSTPQDVLPAVAIPKQKLHEDDELAEWQAPPDAPVSPNSERRSLGHGSTSPLVAVGIAKDKTRSPKSVQKKGKQILETEAEKVSQSEHAGCHFYFNKVHESETDEFTETSSSDPHDKVAPRRLGGVHGAPTSPSFTQDDFQRARGKRIRIAANKRSSRKRKTDESKSQGRNLPDMLTEGDSKHLEIESGQGINPANAAEKPSAEAVTLARAFNSTLLVQQYKQSLPDVPNLPFKGRSSRSTPWGVPTRRVTFTSKVSGLQENYDNQLERFFAMLVQADERLVGTTASSRIQIVDCSLNGESTLDFNAVLTDVYWRLSAILCQTDPWEIRFRQVEDFVESNGRLPSRTNAAHSLHEKRLGTWLGNQNIMLKCHKLPVQRVSRLLNSAFPLIRERAEGWLAGDRDGIFRKRCAELKQYLTVHGALPSRYNPLGRWVHGQRTGGLNWDPVRKKMLQNLHPLVRQLLDRWGRKPMHIRVRKWEEHLRTLNELTFRHGRLPAQKAAERTERYMYSWLHLQRQRIQFGVLPQSLAQQLYSSHPLIVEATREAEQRGRKSRFFISAFLSLASHSTLQLA